MLRKIGSTTILTACMAGLALASADWMPIKDAQPCRKAGSLTAIAQPYVTQMTSLREQKEKAEKEAQKNAGNTGFVPMPPPGGVQLPPGVPNQTGLVPQWKPGQTWTPGSTAYKPTPTPGGTTPIPNSGTPAAPRRFPRPVNCGHH
jgi:hypothetical protein